MTGSAAAIHLPPVSFTATCLEKIRSGASNAVLLTEHWP